MSKMNGIRLLAGTLLSCALWTSIAAAGEPRTHDGFFLRLSAGIGAGRTEIEGAGGSAEFSGGAGDGNLAIGGMVAPNFAIHGTFFGFAMDEPDAEISITGLGSVSGELDGTVALSGVGGGVTYYFMPVNMYLSGSVGFGQLSLETDDDNFDLDGESDTGLVLDLTLGKEWWVGNSWGLGIAAGFGYHSVPDENFDENWSGTSFALRFTATLN